MAVAPPANVERAFGVTNIKSHIPLILDLDDHNYDAWRELFLTHCLTFDVLGHIDGTSIPVGNNDVQWLKRDGLVKLWIYGTLAPQLFRSSFKTGGNARDIWIRIENQFRNNKEARAIQLDNELRTTEIGDLSIQAYCQKLKSISDLLSNVDAPVSDRTLVMYLLNGLNEKFDNITNVIKHKDPFPSFETAKSMLEMEESRLKKTHKMTPRHLDHSSSPSALTVVESQSNSRQNQQRFSNSRGTRRNNGNRFRGRGYNQRPNWASNNFWPGPFPQWSNQFPPWSPNMNQNQRNRGLLGSRPSTPNFQQAHVVESYQPTTDYAQAFNSMTLGDPSVADWYMDSGATSHLASSSGTLNSVFNLNTGCSVIVGNGSKIPIIASGSSLLPSNSRPLSLKSVLVTPNIIKNLVSVRRFTKDNFCSVEFDPYGFSVKDLNTKKVLLRSESDGDLYPVSSCLNKSARNPSAFLTTSPSLWHRRLGHTNNETLKSLISSNSLLCNKDSLPLICKACQLGKHNKLPFSRSTTIVSRPFELVHSDVWTSPIPSISGIQYYVLF